MRFILILIMVLICQHSLGNDYNFYGRAATYEESYFRGVAQMLAAKGRLLESAGYYENLHQDAVKKSIDNKDAAVRTKWKLQDDWRTRNAQNFADNWEKRLDNAERLYALKQRESELIQKGVLPAKQPARITIRGRSYYNIKDWVGTADWLLNRYERERNASYAKMTDQRTEIRRKQSVAFAKWYDSLSFLGKQQYEAKKATNKMMGEMSPRPSFNFPYEEREMDDILKDLTETEKKIAALRNIIKDKGNIKLIEGDE